MHFKRADLAGASEVRAPTFVLSHVQGTATARARLFETGTTPIGEVAVAMAPGTVCSPSSRRSSAPTASTAWCSTKPSAPVTARTSVIATEHWDDAVPTSIDGRDALGWYYASLQSSADGQIQNYAEDDPSKLEMILDWLDEADYISMSSNRLYASIPACVALPDDHGVLPRAARRRARFRASRPTSRPSRGWARSSSTVRSCRSGCATPTRPRVRLAGIQVPYPPAEEAFSVYDHPRVLLYRKTASYSRDRVRQTLGKYDLSRVIRQRPSTPSTRHAACYSMSGPALRSTPAGPGPGSSISTPRSTVPSGWHGWRGWLFSSASASRPSRSRSPRFDEAMFWCSSMAAMRWRASSVCSWCRGRRGCSPA